MNRFKQARKIKKLTTAQVAAYLGYSRRQVEHWESGENEPDQEILKRLAALYDVSIDYLLGADEGIMITKREYSALIEAKKAIQNIENRQSTKTAVITDTGSLKTDTIEMLSLESAK